MGKQKVIGYGSMKKLGEGAYEVDYSGLSHLKSLHRVNITAVRLCLAEQLVQVICSNLKHYHL